MRRFRRFNHSTCKTVLDTATLLRDGGIYRRNSIVHIEIHKHWTVNHGFLYTMREPRFLNVFANTWL